eukprot:NODE_10341_length_1359_cov_2.937500.p1 GENE.NODE_10341_length_1359_cov_2.937500~~NODE_10341_length_1359_cov_2.937500.p1  ORF type:complete len:334 (-),score=80.91 NODE_10341_length_1359_cov_2.937500:237-1238(-)
MCEAWATPTAVLCQQLGYATSMLSSMVASSYLIYVCTVRLRRHTRELFVQQILAISITDVIIGIWCYVLPSISERNLLLNGNASWCTVSLLVQRILQMMSLLFSSALALGLLAFVQRAHRLIRLLHVAPVFIVPLAALLNADYFVHPGFQYVGDVPLLVCEANPTTQNIFAIEVLIIFMGVVCVEVAMIRHAAVTADLARRRSMKSGTRYIVAYFVSYSLFVISQVFIVLFPQFGNYNTCQMWALHVFRDNLYFLNGFLNFLAFRLHLQQVIQTHAALARTRQRRQRTAGLRVGFCEDDVLEEVYEFEVDSGGAVEEQELGDFLIELRAPQHS